MLGVPVWFEVENLDVLCWVWRCGLKLYILTVYVRIWWCCFKLWLAVEHIGVLCWVLAVWFEVEDLEVVCWVWRCGLKLRIEVEHLDVLCWDLAVRFLKLQSKPLNPKHSLNPKH